MHRNAAAYLSQAGATTTGKMLSVAIRHGDADNMMSHLLELRADPDAKLEEFEAPEAGLNNV